MSMQPRRRLTPDQRREEILEIGASLFVQLPYEQVMMDDIARAAGVSRALVYRYFPSKRDLFAAVFKRDSDRLLDASPIDPNLDLHEQIRQGLDAHLDYFAEHRNTILTANRGALAGDPTVQAIISDQLASLRSRLLDAVEPDARSRQVLTVVLDGWLAFVRAVCIDWLEEDTLPRDLIRDLCFDALLAILTATQPSSTARASAAKRRRTSKKVTGA